MSQEVVKRRHLWRPHLQRARQSSKKKKSRRVRARTNHFLLLFALQLLGSLLGLLLLQALQGRLLSTLQLPLVEPVYKFVEFLGFRVKDLGLCHQLSIALFRLS